jgi:hypothetical protein
VVSHIPHPRGAGPVGDRSAWEAFLPRLRAVRDARPRPGRDDKLLTDQNGLALEAFAWLGRLTHEPRFHEATRDLAAFIASRHSSTGLLRTGERPAYITDYGAAVCGLCAAFDLLGDPQLIAQAEAIAHEAVQQLRGDNGGFFSTPLGRSDLIRRTQEHTDNAWPGGEAQLALGFARLWTITGGNRWHELANGIVRAAAPSAVRAPASSITLIQAWRQLRDGPRTLVVCGEDPALLAAARSCRDPGIAVIPVATCREQTWECLAERRNVARPQVLLCLGTRCLAPAYSVSEVIARLTEV